MGRVGRAVPSIRRFLDATFALNLSVGLGAMAVVFQVAADTTTPVVVGPLVAAVAALAVLVRRPAVVGNALWGLGFGTFASFVLLDVVGDFGVRAGTAGPLVALAVWVASLALGGGLLWAWRTQRRRPPE